MHRVAIPHFTNNMHSIRNIYKMLTRWQPRKQKSTTTLKPPPENNIKYRSCLCSPGRNGPAFIEYRSHKFAVRPLAFLVLVDASF